MKTEFKDDNELIADFMGRRYGQNADRNGYLKYDTSWDHLMPVVEKIAEYRLGYPEEANKVCEAKVVIGKQYLYEKVVEFIKWHNSQK